jgi:Xaa-Pro aminopeptidase
MSKTSRRTFLASTVAASAAAACGGAGAETQQGGGQQPRGGPRGTPFAKVQDVPDNVRRIPSDQYPLPFSDQEYNDRLKKTREKMSQLGIDLLYVTLPEGHCYLHGYEVTWYRAQSQKAWYPMTATAVHVDHDQMIFIGGENAVPSWAKDRRGVQGGGTPEGSAKAVAKLLSDEKWLKPGTRVGQEFWSYLPNRAVSEIFSKAFLEKSAKVVDGSDVMRKVRLIKSPAEIEAIEMAARIADIGHRAIANGFRPGMSHAEVYSLATSAMFNAGGEIAGIAQGVIPTKPKTLHLIPSRRTIEAGEPFIVDLGGVYKRYHANIARTFYWGDPTPELQRLSDAAKGGIEVLVKTAQAGTPVATVNKAMRDFYKEAGVYDIRGYSGGYDIGIAFPPDWVGDFEFSVNTENPPGVFEANMVTQYECALQKPDPGRKYDALANNIETFAYGSPTRRLSSIDLSTIWLG